DNRYYLPSSTHDEQYEVLWSIPLYHPKIFVDLSKTDLRSQIKRPFSPAIVAILNIGSNSSASRLRKLQNEDEMTQLYRICQLTLNSILVKLQVTNVE
ncbi:MAG TPA: hypothetical protein VI387_04910, partial [Candidatus Brocadiales bacterium]|nr:hypothetical protein [Candidatus Brocadiales bacterium]